MIRYLTQLLALSFIMIAGNVIAAAINETSAQPLQIAQQGDTNTQPDGGKPKPPEGEEEPEC
ncbi:MAG: hypothetical protein OEQ18_09660 [Gammaproteobacteria bacterium]|nr:hypothetical protein [Gammaproteobacteria bacterium]